MYGITHRFCPEMSQFLLNCTSLLFPGPAGFGQCSGSILYDWAAKALDIKHKYPMRWYFCDKFFLPIIYGSQKLNKIDEEYDIQGTNIRAQGRMVSLLINFGSMTGNANQSPYMYMYTALNQLVQLRSDGSIFVQRD